MTLLPVAEAQTRVLALARPAVPETLPLAEALGRYAATDVVALRTQPARPLSAMRASKAYPLIRTRGLRGASRVRSFALFIINFSFAW